MQLHLHPTRNEALTASGTAFTRWSLGMSQDSGLAQFSTVPESVFHCLYTPRGQMLTFGGITASPDGLLFAHVQLRPHYTGVIEWRRWDDLSVARTSAFPHSWGEYGGLASSPDGRWLVIETAECLFLIDWQTGEVLSQHETTVTYTNSLTFDVSSTFVAGVFGSGEGGFLKLWRLDPVGRFVPRPLRKDWQTHKLVPQDNVSGSMALTLVYEDADRVGVAWPNRYLAEAPGSVTFSPDSRIVLFCLNSSLGVGGCALIAFEVPSGRLLWSAHNAVEATSQAIFSPDSSMLLLPEQGGKLLVYRVEDGTLVQRLPTGLSEPVQALAFDHEGKLWLAAEETLVLYQPRG